MVGPAVVVTRSLSNDPKFEEKLIDVVGLYLSMVRTFQMSVPVDEMPDDNDEQDSDGPLGRYDPAPEGPASG